MSWHFTGIALESSPTAEFKPAAAQPRPRASQLLGNMAGLKQALLQLSGLGLAIEVFAMISPMFMG